MSGISIVWFRQDLRLEDNPALQAAHERGRIVPVFIWSPDEEASWAPGGAARWWLDASLRALEAELRAAGLRLVVQQGPTARTLAHIAAAAGAGAVFWNRRYEPQAVARDRALKQELRANGFVAESFNSALLMEPWDIRNGAGKPFRVFTPFWKQLLTQFVDPVLQRAPRALQPGPQLTASRSTSSICVLEFVGMSRWRAPGDRASSARAPNSAVSSPKPQPTTTQRAIDPTGAAPRACHRIYTSGRSGRGKFGRRWQPLHEPRATLRSPRAPDAF